MNNKRSELRIAYLINVYPKVSHSFIRREIAALEELGHQVHRFSIRASTETLPDPADQAEYGRTRVLLEKWTALATAMATTAVMRPLNLVKAISEVVRMARRGGAGILRHGAYLAEACLLAKRMAELQIKHVHAHFGTNPAAVARLAHIVGGASYSFTVHGPDEFDAPYQIDLPGKISDAVLVAAVSQFGYSQLMRWSAVKDWPKLRIVRCGLDEMFLQRPSATSGTLPGQFCCIARLSGQKGLPILVQAAHLLEMRGADFQITLIGDGELRGELETMIESYGLERKIHLVGSQDSRSVREYLAQSHAFVLPSFAEGLPVVIMEAMAMCKPVIVTAIAGTPELVDSSCGWVVPAGSPEALAEAMYSALSASPEVRQQMGEVGRSRVRQMHDARRNAASLVEHLQNTIQASS